MLEANLHRAFPLSAAHPADRSQRPAGPLVDFLRSVQPKVEEVLARHEVPEGQAEEILRSTLQILVWKWESVRNREAWLLAVLERKCSLLAAAPLATEPTP